MKKFAVLCCALLTAVSAFAYYDDDIYSSHNDEMSGFEIFTLIVMIGYIILSIVLLVRWWKLTTNVEQIRQQISPASPTLKSLMAIGETKLTYLVAIGEKEQAQKAALKMLVDSLMPIYSDVYNCSKAETMDKEIQSLLPKIQKLGLSVPDYVTSGEKFIDYIHSLTDAEPVLYKV